VLDDEPLVDDEVGTQMVVFDELDTSAVLEPLVDDETVVSDELDETIDELDTAAVVEDEL
jgi:hypothetical protein